MTEDNLPKSQRKIAREIIEKGLMREYKEGIEKLDKIISNWKNHEIDNREAYHKLYESLTSTDRHIARRYNRMTGSEYVYILQLKWQME